MNLDFGDSIHDLFNTFIAPYLRTDYNSLENMRIHFYQHVVKQLTNKILQERLVPAVPEDVFRAFIDSCISLGLLAYV